MNIPLLKKREQEIKEALLLNVDILQQKKKELKAISDIFTDLCEEKLRVQTALFELEGRVTHTKPKLSDSKESNEQIRRKLSVKREWDEVQALLASHGLQRRNGYDKQRSKHEIF
jgi:hypothetical protein